MAISNWVDYSKIPNQESPWKNMLENVLKGYQMEKEPAKMAEEQKKRELATGLKDLELKHKPKEYALGDETKSLANSLQKKALEHYEEKFQADLAATNRKGTAASKAAASKAAGSKFNAAVANEQGIWELEHPAGTQLTQEEQVEHITRLKNALNIGLQHTQAGTARTGILNETQDQRGETQQGKLLTESKDVADGFYPGTGRKQQFESPKVQEFYKDQYDLKNQKERSDSVTRNRSLYAGLIDTTFDNINVDKLVRYSGIEGTIDKYAARAQIAPEEEQKKYREYTEEQTKVLALAKQIRQFYGDSISPGNLKKLEEVTNPAKWSESPAVAKAQFEALKNIVKQETRLYRQALSSIAPFQNQEGGTQTAVNPSTFDFSQYPVAGGG